MKIKDFYIVFIIFYLMKNCENPGMSLNGSVDHPSLKRGFFFTGEVLIQGDGTYPSKIEIA